MSCNTPCYKRDTCNTRWHRAGSTGTGARVPRRAVCADARPRAAAARGRHGQVRAWSDGATYMPPNTATDV
eukprot:733949-Pleurochrysis_carterae.AAC.1